MAVSSVRKQASIATLAVSGSRVAGLVREMVFAFFFGAGPALDAFIAAFRIPNLLRDLFSEGALSNAFVTVFSKKAVKEGDRAAWDLANRVFGFVAVVLGLVTLLGIYFSPWIVHAVASGFTGEKFQYTVWLNRVLFPFILFVSFAAIAMGMLNTRGKFALPQSASTFFNVTSIVTGLLFAYLLEPEGMRHSFALLMNQSGEKMVSWEAASRALTGMAIGTLLGGVVQWVVQMPAAHKLGFRFRPTVDFKDEGLRQVLKLTGPAIIGGAAVQVNVLVNTNFASYLADGSIAWLNFAFRLMQFPIGVFGVAIALATAPAVARLAAQNDPENFKKTLRESIQLTLFLCIPSALGLVLLAQPIMALIYQHGQFTASDTHQAALALMAYSVGLTGYALIKVYQPAYLAHHDAKTPMLVSLLSIGINFGMNWLFVFVLHFAHWGLALGTSCVAIWDILLLSILFRKKLPQIWTKTLLKQGLKILSAALLSCLAGWLTCHQLSARFGNEGVFLQLLLVFPPIGVTVLFYYFFCSRLGVNEVTVMREWIKKKFRSS
ncbi:MAG: murein biosynthesis integral membrane protein MurJ [Deltaproteobacteria bacterium]|nr:murein biosynthesis integral membrane protein MurJ [Deltaproteobacteria bacterium]